MSLLFHISSTTPSLFLLESPRRQHETYWKNTQRSGSDVLIVHGRIVAFANDNACLDQAAALPVDRAKLWKRLCHVWDIWQTQMKCGWGKLELWPTIFELPSGRTPPRVKVVPPYWALFSWIQFDNWKRYWYLVEIDPTRQAVSGPSKPCYASKKRHEIYIILWVTVG